MKVQILMNKTPFDMKSAHEGKVENFDKVVEVVFHNNVADTNFLEYIYSKAQNMDEEGWVAGFTGMSKPCRSMSVGDMIIINDTDKYIVDHVGFKKV